MGTKGTPTVDEADFYDALKRLRDVRAWAVKRKIDPWAFRQAMITIIAIDTEAALERGIKYENIAKFDMIARASVLEFLESIPEEGRARGQ